MENVKILPELLEKVIRKNGVSKQFSYRQDEQWKSLSSDEFYRAVRSLTAGLLDLGLERGEGVGILATPSPHWLMFDLATMLAGGISIPMFPNISDDNFQFEVKDADIRYLFADHPQSLTGHKVSSHSFKKIVYLSSAQKGTGSLAFRDLIQEGENYQRKHPEFFSQALAQIRENDLCTIIYTSGSTGPPKGVELTHRNLVSQIKGARIRFPMDPQSDVMLSCLPLAHIFERMVIYFYLSTGCPIYIADDIKKVGDYLRDVHPTVLTLVPRLLEKVFAKMRANVQQAQGIKKMLAGSGFRRACELPPHQASRGLLGKILDHLVYAKMRQALGGRLRLVISGSAPMPKHLGQYFLNIGLSLYEGYGLTEASPVLSVNFPDHNRLGTVGPIFPDVEIKISGEGEILARGPNIMRGYHNNPAETRKVIDEQGWLHTGDKGKLDDEGYLTITGRFKELFKTSTGKYVSPIPIEQTLCTHEFVDMAFVIAEGRKFVSCLLFPNFENLKQYQIKHGFADLTEASFLKSDFIRKEMENLLARVNQSLNHWEQVQKFYIVPVPLAIETGELTPTMKIRRHVVEEKFKKVIEEMYKEDDEG